MNQAGQRDKEIKVAKLFHASLSIYRLLDENFSDYTEVDIAKRASHARRLRITSQAALALAAACITITTVAYTVKLNDAPSGQSLVPYLAAASAVSLALVVFIGVWALNAGSYGAEYEVLNRFYKVVLRRDKLRGELPDAEADEIETEVTNRVKAEAARQVVTTTVSERVFLEFRRRMLLLVRDRRSAAMFHLVMFIVVLIASIVAAFFFSGVELSWEQITSKVLSAFAVQTGLVFFFWSYRRAHSDQRMLSNELTTMEAKYYALQNVFLIQDFVAFEQDPPSLNERRLDIVGQLLLSMLRTERNFIVGKNERTVQGELEAREHELIMELLRRR